MLLVVWQGGIDTWAYVRRSTSRTGLIGRTLVFVFLLFATTSDAQTEQTRHILILNSYHKGFQWTDDQTSAIKEVLTSTVPYNICPDDELQEEL